MTSVKLRRIATSANGAGFPHSYQGKNEGDLPFFKVSDFHLPGNARYLKKCTNWISKSDAVALGARVVPQNSILLPKVGAALLGNARRITTRPSLFDNNVLALVSRTGDSRYLHYWTTTMDASELSYPGPVPSLTGSEFLDLTVPISSLVDQRAIADFLDAETARIDALIEKKRRLVGLLVERRDREIDRIVLPDYLPDARRDPTEVPLAAEIPSHWQTFQLGHCLSRITYGFTNPMPVADDGPYMLTANNIGYGFIDFGSARKTTESAFDLNLTDKSRPKSGDVLLTKDGTLGRCAIFRGGAACVNQSIAVLTPNPQVILPELLEHLLRTPTYRDALIFESGGTTIKHLYISRVVKQRIGIPPLPEQNSLVRAFEKIQLRHEELRSSIDRQIELLTEHRQALITAAVTGQLDIAVS